MDEPQQLAFFGPSQAAQPWPPGHRIGPFELQAVVARGPAGLVYRAWDHALARPAAVKEYLPAAWARRDESGAVHPATPAAAAVFERGRQAFLVEARRLALCDTPSLVRVLHLVEAHGTAYRVMPWYTGQVLGDVRRTMAGPPDEGALRALLGDLLDAVEAYQRAGGPHGGVGPGQVMLLEDDRALLLGPGAATQALQSDGPAAVAPGGDLRALADLALFCITGRANEPSDEPVSALIERRFGSQRGARFSDGLLATLDTARSGQAPLTPASFRARLITTPTLPPAAPQVDPATADLIRRVVAAVPPAPAVPRPPAPAAELPPIPGPGPRPYPPLRPRRRAWPWGAVAVGALGLGGLTIWALPFLPPIDPPPAPAEAVLPPAPVAPPAPAAVAPPPPAPVPPPPPPVPPPEPVVVPPKAPAPATAAAPARARVDSPREACGNRTPFSLYRCMQQQCAQPRWTAHAQCVRLRATDRVD